MRLSGALVLVCIIGAPVQVDRVAAQSTGRIASVQPAVSEDQAPTFEDRIANFINEFYLSGERRSDEDLRRLYADRVDYFGKRGWSRARVIADKHAYYARWPRRNYKLLRDTLTVDRRPGPAKIYDISFEYTFDVRSRARVSRGRGRGYLTMDLSHDGGRVTREEGSVIDRW